MVLTKTKSKNIITSDTHEIPEFALEEINEKWFYVYEFIDDDEIVTKIRIYFLNVVKYSWIPLFILLVICYFTLKFVWVFIWIWIIVWVYSIFLIFWSIYYALKWWKISHIVLTEKHFSIWDIIYDYNKENEIYLDNEVWEIVDKFSENPFWKNFLKEEEKEEIENIKWIFYWWADLIWELSWQLAWKKEWAWLAIALWWLYLWFAIVTFAMYVLWSTILLFLWILIRFFIRKYMIIRWNKVLEIQDKFKMIENNSIQVFDSKKQLLYNLEEAFKQEWKDWLLLKINSWFENISKQISNSIVLSKDLLNTIEKSIYLEMFNKEKYDIWLKKQTKDPIDWILVVLNSELSIVDWQIEEIKDNQVWQIQLAKQRLEMKKEELEKYIYMLSELRKRI